MSSLTVKQEKITYAEMLPTNMSSIDGLDLVQVRELLDAELFSSDVSYLYGAGACVQEIKGFDAVSMFRDMKYFMYAYEGDMVVFYSKEIILKFLDDNLVIDYLQYLQMDYKRMVLEQVYKEMARNLLAKEQAPVEIKYEAGNFSVEENTILNSLLLKQGCELPNHFGFVFINTDSIPDYYDKKNIGYVYAFENKALGAVKIGKAKQPNTRIKQLQNMAGCKDGFFVWGEIYNYHNVELELHAFFAKKNHMQEWFNVGFEVASKAIKKVSGQYDMPSKEQLVFSALIDKYNSMCRCNGISAGFNNLHNKKAKAVGVLK